MKRGVSLQFYKKRRSKPSALLGEPPALLPLPEKRGPLYERLRDYQKRAVDFALQRSGAGLFCDPRTGKTWIALSIIEALEAAESLCVVPLTNKNSTWRKLATELLPGHSVTSDYEEYKKMTAPKIFIIHYDELRGVGKKIANRKWDVVIADECQRIKTRNSQQSRDLRRLRLVERRIGLSGTPIDGDPIDLWGQMRFIEPRAFGEVWSDFDMRYLRRTGYMGYERVFIDDRRPDFDARIEPYCMRVTREEAGIAEPRMHWTSVPLLGAQERVYDELDAEFIAAVGNSKVTAKIEATKLVKLQQVTGGFVYDDDNEIQWLGEAKLRKLKYLLRHKVQTPVVIFAQFLPELFLCEQACKQFSDRTAILDGSIKDGKRKKHRTELIESFQRGEIDYLICQQRTGGVGIDLFRARHAIVYSHNHSYIDFDQMKSRLDVPNSAPPDIFLIHAIGTIDDDKKDAVMSKRSITDVILSRMRKG